MNPETHLKPDATEADRTLRLLAALPPPEQLSERVHARLAQQQPEARPRFWNAWLPAQRWQFASAAALAVAVAASTWTLNRPHSPAVVPAPAPVATPSVPTGGFGSASTVRVPTTLHPIKVPPAPHRKAAAGRAAIKTSPKPAVAPGSSLPPAIPGPSHP